MLNKTIFYIHVVLFYLDENLLWGILKQFKMFTISELSPNVVTLWTMHSKLYDNTIKFSKYFNVPTFV